MWKVLMCQVNNRWPGFAQLDIRVLTSPRRLIYLFFAYNRLTYLVKNYVILQVTGLPHDTHHLRAWVTSRCPSWWVVFTQWVWCGMLSWSQSYNCPCRAVISTLAWFRCELADIMWTSRTGNTLDRINLPKGKQATWPSFISTYEKYEFFAVLNLFNNLLIIVFIIQSAECWGNLSHFDFAFFPIAIGELSDSQSALVTTSIVWGFW